MVSEFQIYIRTLQYYYRLLLLNFYHIKAWSFPLFCGPCISFIFFIIFEKDFSVGSLIFHPFRILTILFPFIVICFLYQLGDILPPF